MLHAGDSAVAMVTVTPVEADLPTAVGVPLVAVADVPSAAAGVPLVVVAADMPSAAVAMVAVDTPVEAVTAADMVDTGN